MLKEVMISIKEIQTHYQFIQLIIMVQDVLDKLQLSQMMFVELELHLVLKLQEFV